MTRKRFPSWAGEKYRFWAGSVFDHINDHRQLRNTCETQVYRGLKSNGNRLKSTKKRYKSPEKIFPVSLGAGCRRFESCHSDHADEVAARRPLFTWGDMGPMRFEYGRLRLETMFANRINKVVTQLPQNGDSSLQLVKMHKNDVFFYAKIR